MQRASIIPERDVYRLVMRSKLESAERFEEWVVGEVLPSIRKHGGYIVGQEQDAPDMTRNLDDDETGTHILRIRSENGVEQDPQSEGQSEGYSSGEYPKQRANDDGYHRDRPLPCRSQKSHRIC